MRLNTLINRDVLVVFDILTRNLNQILKCSFITSALFCSSLSMADDLEEKKIYRLEKSVYELESTSDGKKEYGAARNSKFIVIVNPADGDHYVVRFLSIYGNANVTSMVRDDDEYKLPKEIGGTPIHKSVAPSLVGPVSGPLIVPFKYRLDDRSISGEAAIGYYAGIRTELKIPFTYSRIPVSPFIGAGISQIDVATGASPDNRTGITITAGVLIHNWANVNIGLVYGQDRVGDASWVHEGNTWVSFMIGWDL